MSPIPLPIHDHLNKVGNQNDDAAIDLFDTALTCAAVWHEGISLERYHHHAIKVVKALEAMDVKKGVDAIRQVFQNDFGYVLSKKNPLDIQNYDVIRMIERRTAAPQTMALFVVHCVRAAGYPADVIDFPKASFCRLTLNNQRLIVDPSQNFKSMNAYDLRAHLKNTSGNQSELSASYMDPILNRKILINLQNAFKFRLIEMEAYSDALQIVETMCLIDRNEYKLLLEKGVLLARLNDYDTAIVILRQYIERAPHPFERAEARQYIADIQSQMNATTKI